MFEILRYLTRGGKDVFGDWLTSLRGRQVQAKVLVRINRMAIGNFGDCKLLREGVWELRIDCGPGYRVYYAMAQRTCVLLLCGGDKRRQAADIDRAVQYWKDYQQRTKQP